jgi:hypothetical protein
MNFNKFGEYGDGFEITGIVEDQNHNFWQEQIAFTKEETK